MALDDAQGSGRQDRDHEMTDGQVNNLTYAVLKQPTLGWVTNNGDGTFSFDPGTDFRDLGAGETRQVSFNYQASDGWGGTEAACAIVTVTGAADGGPAIDVSYGGTLEHDETQPSHVMEGDVPAGGASPGPPVPPSVGTPKSDATAAPGPATPGGPETRSDAAQGENAGGSAPTHREMDARPAEVSAQGFGQDLDYSAPPANGSARRYTVLAQPSEGRVRPKEDGTFDFLPDPDFPELAVGELYQVTFTCQASDGGGETSTVIAALTVAGTNDGPEACDVSFRLAQGTATPQQAAVVETGKKGTTSGAPDVDEAVRADRPSGPGSGTTTKEEPPGAAVPAVDTAAPPEQGATNAGSVPPEGLLGMAGALPDLVEKESVSVRPGLNPASAGAGPELHERPEPGGTPEDPAPAPADLRNSTRPALARDEPPPPGTDVELQERLGSGGIPDDPDAVPVDLGSSAHAGPVRDEPPLPAAGTERRERSGSGGIPDGPAPAPANPGSNARPATVRDETPPPAARTDLEERPGSSGIPDCPVPAPAGLGSSTRPAPLREEPPPLAAGTEIQERLGSGGIPDGPVPAPADLGSSTCPATVRDEPQPPAAGTELEERPGSGEIPEGPAPAPAGLGNSTRPAPLREEPPPLAAGTEIQEQLGSGGIPDGPVPAPADLESSARPVPVRDEPPPPAAGTEIQERFGSGGIPDGPVPAPADLGSSARPAPLREEPQPPAAGTEREERPGSGEIPDGPAPAPAGLGNSTRPAPLREEPQPPAAGTEIQERLGSGGIPADPVPAPADLGSSARPAPVRDEPPPPAARTDQEERPGSSGIPDGPAPAPADLGSSARPTPVRNEPPPPAVNGELRERLGSREIPDGPAPAPADLGSSARPAPANPHVPDGDATAPAGDTAVGPTGLTDFTLSNDTVPEKCEPGTLVGQVVVAGALNTGGFIYDLQRDAGGRFDINPRTGKITVADGGRLDHGAEASHDVLIQVIDSSGVSCRKTCIIKVLPANAGQGIGHDAGPPDVGRQAADGPDIPAQSNEAPNRALGEAEVWGDRSGEAGEPGPMGGGSEVQEESAGRRHDTLRLDGVTGGPGAGGWSLDLTEGVIVANSGDHILLSGNSVGSIALDGTSVKVAFRGIERVEW
ncbi:MAG: cadherin-like domain-containing protein [Rhodospirillales bacterium]|nr:cadherin-like domain-containing protein [Rhodospirillales bacterium]